MSTISAVLAGQIKEQREREEREQNNEINSTKVQEN